MKATTKHIRVYLTEVPDCELPETWICGMTKEKRNRLNDLKNEADKRLIISAHRLLCYVLKSQYSVSPTEDDWAIGWHGKPYLKKAPHIHFNISHAGNIAMCALHNAPVGVDIEKIKRVDDGVEMRFMSKKELDIYYTASDRISMFHKIWTLKESYVKFCGRGIGADLNRLTVYPDGSSIISNVPGCKFALINVKVPSYQAALCASNIDHSIEWVEKETLEKF